MKTMRIKRHHVILSIAFLVWAGYMIRFAPDAFRATKTVILYR